jgi:hypothetical protein
MPPQGEHHVTVPAHATAAEHGEGADAYARFLVMADPLADAVAAAFTTLPAGRGRRLLERALDHGIDAVPDDVPALADLFAQLDDVPYWVDWDRIHRGGELFLRSGAFGIAVLALSSLPITYSSPGGNKPLVFTGNLLRRAPRRLAETASFAVASSRPGGLHRFGDGFKSTVKVRLMHAQVRRLLWRSGRWQGDDWGAPINQVYLAGTNLALSAVLLDGLERLGFRFTSEEGEALLHLWRYSGYLSGVDPALLCSTRAEARWLGELILRREGPPDADSRALVEALMTATYFPAMDRWRWRVAAAYGLSRSLIGDRLADDLGYPRSPWRMAVPATRPLVAAGTAVRAVRRLVPGGGPGALDAGARAWEWTIEQVLAGARAEFRPPDRLQHQPMHHRDEAHR